jgi:CHAT domain-containing protein
MMRSLLLGLLSIVGAAQVVSPQRAARPPADAASQQRAPRRSPPQSGPLVHLPLAATDPVWQTLPQFVSNRGQLLPPEEESIVVKKAIQAGLRGDDRKLRELLDVISWYRRQSTERWTKASNFLYEDSYSAELMELSRRWTSAYLSFRKLAEHENDSDVYATLLPERRRATRALYGTYAHMRQHPKWDQDPYTAIKGSQVKERLALRRSIASQLWSPKSAELKDEISRSVQQVRNSLRTEGDFYRVEITGYLAEVLNADLYSYVQSMPDETVVVDFVQYDKLSPRPGRADAHAEMIAYDARPHYCAFVISVAKTEGFEKEASFMSATIPTVTRRRHDRVHRVELGECQAIDGAVRRWRDAIDRGGMATEEGREIARLIWEPIERRFLAGAKHVFLVPDGYLSAVPWCAIPLTGNQLVMERYSTALLPYAEYLVQALAPGAAELNSYIDQATGVLAVGKVARNLPYSESEILALKEFVDPQHWVGLTGDDATIERVLSEMPKAGHVHFAVHGIFGEAPLLRARRYGLFGSGASSQDSLFYSCLLLASAKPHDQPQDRILTADMVSELDLSKMKLAVLSACQTGAGEHQSGEGTFALTRAFHLAGCEEVVSTSWPIYDQRSAELMGRFYDHYYHGKPLLEALRTAQLEMYRTPARGGDEGEGRSPLNVNSTFEAPPAPGAITADGRHTPPKYWAAFFLSGSGSIARPTAPCESPEVRYTTNAYRTPVLLDQTVLSELQASESGGSNR